MNLINKVDETEGKKFQIKFFLLTCVYQKQITKTDRKSE